LTVRIFLFIVIPPLIILSPYQKEPKLARARQIPEWEEYDSEIAQLSRSLAAEGKIHSRMASADANVLAGTSNGGQDTNKEIQEAEGSRDEELREGKGGDSEELVGIERTRDEL
jgi:UDP-glucose:glycoprotein glucosyltransferase